MKEINLVSPVNKRIVETDDLIANFVFKNGDLVDLVSGNEMQATLPAQYGKTYVKDNVLIKSAPDQPRFTDNGLLIEGEATNLYGAANRWEDWADVYHTFIPDITTIQGWPIHRCIVNTDPVLIWHRVNPRVGAADSDVSVGQTITDSVLVAGSSTGTIYYNVYASGGIVSIAREFDLNTLTVVGGGGDGGIIENAYIKKVGDLYECSITITYSVDATAPAGWGCKPTVPGDYIDIAIMQREVAPHRTSWIPNTTGETVQTIARATEAANPDGNGYSIDFDLIPEVKAALGELVIGAQGNVMTPTGVELIDNEEAWTYSSGWSDDGVNSVSASDAAQWTSAYKVILEAGKRYVVTLNASGIIGGFRVKQTDGGGVSNFDITTDGFHSGIVETDIGTGFSIMALDAAGNSGTFTNISVKEITPQATLAFQFTAKCNSADLPNGCGVLGFTNAASAYSGVYYDGESGFFQRLFAGRNCECNFSVGDIVKIVASLDAESGSWCAATSVNGVLYRSVYNNSYNELHSSYFPLGKLSLSPSIQDRIIPMSAGEVSFWSQAMTIDQVEQEVVNV